MTEQVVQAANALSVIAETMEVVVDAVKGYRTTLEEAGFSPTMSEVGAMEYHTYLLNAMTNAMNTA